MSSSNPSDPRLLLPEWLRDGEVPASAVGETVARPAALTVPVASPVEEVVVLAAVEVTQPLKSTIEPFSERLSLDTRLDPVLLISASDLPAWLGGLERTSSNGHSAQATVTPQALRASAPVAAAVVEPELYTGASAPEASVIDVQVNGWYLVAGAIGLLILLVAALKLYLS